SLNFYSAGFSPDLTHSSLVDAAKHMLHNEIKTNYFLGLSFFKSSSNYPKQEIHYQDIKSKYPQLEQESVQANDNNGIDNPILKDELPETVKSNQNTGPIFTRLSHFYETNAFFKKYNIHSELVADPFASIASMPASSAELFSPQNERNLPGFLPENCTACGNCYMICPHSALPPIAIGVEDLLKSGAELAKSSGKLIRKLFPHYKNLSRLAAQNSGENAISTVSDLVKPAFEKLCDKLNLKETDKDLLDQEFYFIMEQIGDFPISLNDVLYDIPSKIEAGSGKLFSIVVNPMSCTGCGLCQDVCEDNAIEMLLPKDQNINKVFSEFRAWEQMPDTETKTINQLHLDEKVNSLAAILLSRNYYTSMSGFGPDESENASKTIMHLLSAITEANIQPGVISQLNYIDKLSSDLTDSVHKELSDALPDDDITELSEVLKNTPKKKILVRDIIDNIRADTASKYINTQSLGRKIELIKSLKELYQLIKIGSRGNGKSRYGLVIASKDKFNWAGTYPFNHFSGPSIILQDENSAEFILGLMSGQIRFLLDQIKLLRRANLEIKGKYDPVIHDQQIAQLEWDDLTEDEKSYLPPVFMLIDHKGMSSVSRSSFLKLLTYKVPVKVLSFDSATCHPLTSKEEMTQRHSMFMSNLALTDVYIYQGSLVNADRFFEGISVGIKNSKPAFFNLFVPDNSQLIPNGKNVLELSKLVENSRMLPDYSYLKIKSDNNYNVLLETDWNASSEKNWPQIELGNGGNTTTYELSWADWAFQQKAWQSEFEIQEDTSDLIPVTEYLNLKTAEKKGKTPIIKVFESEEVHSYCVSSLVIEMTEMVLDQWREIQRMVDKLSDFPDQLKEQVRKELSKELNEEIIKIEKEYEQKLEDQKEKQKKELRKTLKEKLLMLSKMKKGNKTV
ncbi:MAG: 4Fe-4S binding protein, partial [Bacteroidia bacterium]|nr:4Fe-4S binding protein [Bacteroidia bacterium]